MRERENVCVCVCMCVHLSLYVCVCVCFIVSKITKGVWEREREYACYIYLAGCLCNILSCLFLCWFIKQVNYTKDSGVSQKFCNILVYASFQLIYHTTKAVQAMRNTCCSIMVVSALTCCSWFHSLCDLKAAWTNLHLSLFLVTYAL